MALVIRHVVQVFPIPLVGFNSPGRGRILTNSTVFRRINNYDSSVFFYGTTTSVSGVSSPFIGRSHYLLCTHQFHYTQLLCHRTKLGLRCRLCIPAQQNSKFTSIRGNLTKRLVPKPHTYKYSGRYSQ